MNIHEKELNKSSKVRYEGINENGKRGHANEMEW